MIFKKIAVFCSDDFLSNTAGGGQVFLCNLKTLNSHINPLSVYVFDFKNGKLLNYSFYDGKVHYKNTKLNIKYFPSKYRNIILKYISFLWLCFKYDFLWVEHFYSLPSFKLTPKFVFNKIIYSQHDFLFKIKALKDNTNKEKLYLEEKNTIEKCKLMIAGNQLEVDYAINIFNIKSYYLPISIDTTTFTELNLDNEIIHLGSLSTTASKIGLEHFLNDILPLFKKKIQVTLIGHGTEIINKHNIKGLGFVDNLSKYLKTGSICIIPWRYDSGQRTRVFEALAHGCIIVSYKILGKIIPELSHDENCILVDTETDFANAIENLIINKDLKKKLTQGSIDLTKKFNFEARVEKLHKILV
jgi:hypothetical protein